MDVELIEQAKGVADNLSNHYTLKDPIRLV